MSFHPAKCVLLSITLKKKPIATNYQMRGHQLEQTKSAKYLGVTLNRPKLEYCSSVWSPHTKRDIRKLEGMQRKAARFVMADNKRESSVSTVLQKLEWPTLEARNTEAKVTLFYKAHTDTVKISIPVTRQSRCTDKYMMRCHAKNQLTSVLLLPNSGSCKEQTRHRSS